MPLDRGRANQRNRTRRDLLEAALKLSGNGKAPSLDEIAEAAHVSRATAYRYFPNVDDLLTEASLHVAFPEPEFLADAPADPIERMLLVDDAVERMVGANEAALRTMIASAARMPLRSDDVPARQNRRLPLIEAALAPVKNRLSEETFQSLARALSLVIGTEAMMVFKDVLQLTPEEARKVRRWTIASLVDAALRAPPSPS